MQGIVVTQSCVLQKTTDQKVWRLLIKKYGELALTHIDAVKTSLLCYVLFITPCVCMCVRIHTHSR